jgi:hypothetical protein
MWQKPRKFPSGYADNSWIYVCLLIFALNMIFKSRCEAVGIVGTVKQKATWPAEFSAEQGNVALVNFPLVPRIGGFHLQVEAKENPITEFNEFGVSILPNPQPVSDEPAEQTSKDGKRNARWIQWGPLKSHDVVAAIISGVIGFLVVYLGVFDWLAFGFKTLKNP